MDQTYASSLLLAICGIAAVFLLSTVVTDRKPYPNGPVPIPFLGNVGTLRKLSAKLDPQLLQLKKDWGSLCMLWYGRSPVIIINSPRAARELLNEVCSLFHRCLWVLNNIKIRDMDVISLLKLRRALTDTCIMRVKAWCNQFIPTRTECIPEEALAMAACFHTYECRLPLPTKTVPQSSKRRASAAFSKVSRLRIDHHAAELASNPGKFPQKRGEVYHERDLQCCVWGQVRPAGSPHPSGVEWFAGCDYEM